MAIEEMLGMKTWAVVGASNNIEKYGNKVYTKLREKGYKVYPINPNSDTIEGDKCYKDLSSLPERPDVVNMVVAPQKGVGVIEEAEKLGIKNLWFQPGTYDNKILGMVADKNMNSVVACVLVALH